MREIVAAGAVVFRGEGKDREVCLVHRPAYDDWALPKGKLELGESIRRCAVREVHEEAGLDVTLTAPLATTRYRLTKGTRKAVHWWRADLRHEGDWTPGAEIDDKRWLSVSEALRTMSYDDERSVLAEAADLAPTVVIALVRHGKAVARSDWGGPDSWRPLNARGRNHARALVSELAAYGVSTLISSPATRCRQTLGPYARLTRTCITDCDPLSEESFEHDEKPTVKAMRDIRLQAWETKAPTAVCGHRPVLPSMTDALKAQYRPLKTGQVLLLHVGNKGTVRQELISHTVDSDD